MSVLRVEHAAQTRTDDGMVVDDEHADGHDDGTSATSVVPAPAVDSTCSRPPTSATRSRMPTRPRPSVARRRRVEAARRRPRRPPTTAFRLALQEDADAARAGVLDDVRERLLDDAVERRLGLGRQPLVAELRLEVDAQPALLAERLGEPLDAPARARSRRARTGAARPRAGARPAASRRRARGPTRSPRAPRPTRPPARAASGRAGSRSAPAPSRRAARARAARARAPAPRRRGGRRRG